MIRRHDHNGFYDPVGSLPPSKHPFQLFIVFACLVSGVTGILESPPSVEELIPTGWRIAYNLSLVLCGVIGLVSPWWKDRVFGLLAERIAMTILVVSPPIYGLGVLFLAGPAAIVAAAFTVTVGLAAAVRIRDITRELEYLRRWMELVM